MISGARILSATSMIPSDPSTMFCTAWVLNDTAVSEQTNEKEGLSCVIMCLVNLTSTI